MNASLKNTAIELRRRNVERITHCKPGTTIVCEKGILWLTQPNDPRDYILFPGERFDRVKRDNVLVEAIHDAVVRVI